jgi:long-chain fatty acid transport protein
MGYNHQLTINSTIGIAIYGNGGMNTDYSNAVWENFAPAPNQQVAILPDGSQQLLFQTDANGAIDLSSGRRFL